ncbi:MAG TPA: membrane protein insertion efficiency factor YidD [Anaeromyxobacteraceae bacterium]|nr:membrane protein insertion efficiency factor YidD [Anaeromyxobacteraceae bacterium]
MTGLLLALVSAQAVAASPGAASAAGEVAWLAEPATAVAYVLGEESPPAPPAAAAGPGWDGALPTAVLKGLFATYRALLSSQDDSPCGFVPSCSAYSEQAIATYGFGEGLLLTADRLLRDHPLALGQYETDLATGLMRDPPTHYGLGDRR